MFQSDACRVYRWQWDRTNRQADGRVREDPRPEAKHAGERGQLRRDRNRRITEQRQRFRDGTRADRRDLFTIQRQEQRRFHSAMPEAECAFLNAPMARISWGRERLAGRRCYAASPPLPKADFGAGRAINDL